MSYYDDDCDRDTDSMDCFPDGATDPNNPTTGRGLPIAFFQVHRCPRCQSERIKSRKRVDLVDDGTIGRYMICLQCRRNFFANYE